MCPSRGSSRTTTLLHPGRSLGRERGSPFALSLGAAGHVARPVRGGATHGPKSPTTAWFCNGSYWTTATQARCRAVRSGYDRGCVRPTKPKTFTIWLLTATLRQPLAWAATEIVHPQVSMRPLRAAVRSPPKGRRTRRRL